MKRTLAIAKRVLTELRRDKRTLAFVLVMPVVILWLLNVMFSANSSTNVTVATVNVNPAVTKQIDAVKHVKVEKFTQEKTADYRLKHQQVDAVIKQTGNQYRVRYANIDASKTTLTKQALSSALTKNQIMTLGKALATMKGQLAQRSGQTLPNNQQVAAQQPQIKNSYQYGDKDTNFFSKMIPVFIGFFVFFFVFLISGMGLLNERTSGTLDRLLATPVKRGEVFVGYLISYGTLALIQTIVVVCAAVWILKIEVVGNILGVMVVNILMALVALTFGMLLSTLASSEFQMMQFIPIVIVPQLLFSGIIPLDAMASWVQVVGKLLPLTYAGDTMTGIIMKGESLAQVSGDLWALLIFVVVLGSITVLSMKRYRKV